LPACLEAVRTMSRLQNNHTSNDAGHRQVLSQASFGLSMEQRKRPPASASNGLIEESRRDLERGTDPRLRARKRSFFAGTNSNMRLTPNRFGRQQVRNSFGMGWDCMRLRDRHFGRRRREQRGRGRERAPKRAAEKRGQLRSSTCVSRRLRGGAREAARYPFV